MNIYTDGACRDNRRQNGVAEGSGGWAFIILEKNQGEDMHILKKSSGSVCGTTNQQMELMAVIESFEEVFRIKKMCEIVLYSDSAYVVNCMRDKWYTKWELNDWLNSKGTPVENRELWERLISLTSHFSVTFHHVSRNSTKYIKMVDEMAKDASRKQTTRELS